MLPSLTQKGPYIRTALRCRILPRGILAVYLLASPDGCRYDLFIQTFSRRTFDCVYFPDLTRDAAKARFLFRAVVRGRVTPYAADEVIDDLLSASDKI